MNLIFLYILKTKHSFYFRTTELIISIDKKFFKMPVQIYYFISFVINKDFKKNQSLIQQKKNIFQAKCYRFKIKIDNLFKNIENLNDLDLDFFLKDGRTRNNFEHNLIFVIIIYIL